MQYVFSPWNTHSAQVLQLTLIKPSLDIFLTDLRDEICFYERVYSWNSPSRICSTKISPLNFTMKKIGQKVQTWKGMWRKEGENNLSNKNVEKEEEESSKFHTQSISLSLTHSLSLSHTHRSILMLFIT